MRRGEEAVERVRAGKTGGSNKGNSDGRRHLPASCSIYQGEGDEEADDEDNESESASVTGTASVRICDVSVGGERGTRRGVIVKCSVRAMAIYAGKNGGQAVGQHLCREYS